MNRLKSSYYLINIVFTLLLLTFLNACRQLELPEQTPTSTISPQTSTPEQQVLPSIESSPMPTKTSEIQGYTISGWVNEHPICLGGYNARGARITLNPTGRTATTDLGTGHFVFEGVDDGDYVLQVDSCHPDYGCWPDTPITVDGQDVEVTLCLP